MKKYLTHTPYTLRIDRWTNDIAFVIDQLQNKKQLTNNNVFSRVDLKNIGAMGHSAGGAASAVASAADQRIKAAINLDGSQWGSLMDSTIAQPFLWVTADKDPIASAMDIDAFIYEQTAKQLHHINVAHATHTNFYDLALWFNHPAIMQTGSIDPQKMLSMVNRCTLAFSDQYLKHKPQTLPKTVNSFDELTLESE